MSCNGNDDTIDTCLSTNRDSLVECFVHVLVCVCAVLREQIEYNIKRFYCFTSCKFTIDQIYMAILIWNQLNP